MLTADSLRELLRYDPEDGSFVWVAGGYKTGKVAGFLDRDGYRRIFVRGKPYGAARLAWLYMTGSMPADQIDHINRNPSDDRWVNLREASAFQQSGNRRVRSNSKTGVKGVRFQKGKYYSYIPAGRSFDTAEEAHEAYMKLARDKFGEFAGS